MKNKGLLVGLIAIAIFVIGYFVWKSSNNPVSKDKEIIKIGAILPLTGDLATYGQSGQEGMEIALDEFNKEFPNKVKLVLEDDKGTVKDGISAINKLITNDKVQIIMGSMSSGVTLGIAPIVEKNKVVLVAPTSTASEVTNAGDFIFRICVSDEYEGKAMATWGNANDYKHFLPRIFELTAELRTPYEIWIAFDKLTLAEFQNWAEEEQKVIRHQVCLICILPMQSGGLLIYLIIFLML